MHDRSATTLEELVAAAMAGADTAPLAAAWRAGSPVGPLLHPHVHSLLADARARGWTEAELEHLHGRRDGATGALVRAGLSDDTASIDRWRRDRRLGAEEALGKVSLLRTLLRLLGDPPGGRAAGESPGADAALLERVRALLAKAESTTFPAEAEALTAKAHELMARHAIEEAVLEAGGQSRGGAVGSRRVLVCEPYLRAKVQLLAQIASACGCRAVSAHGGEIVVVFGHAGDLEAVDLLHTSLLVQATTAMLAAGGDLPGAHGRSRTFRGSFLTAFAVRVGERLRAATERVVEEAKAASAAELLPVLASRAAAVDEAVAASFPRLRTARPRTGTDPAGWYAGRRAADRADLGTRSSPLAAARPLPS